MVHLNFGAKLFSILGLFCVSIRRINEGFMVEFKVQFKKKGNDSLLCMFDVVSKTSKLAIKGDRFIAQIFFV